ncbi:hypothetical protein HBN54_003530 [Hymenobacter sp. 1B]|uniref:Uncharacterized protein n=1 Tax=Hymenobacter artigasi TaxID=2719616 RepID=A0ABX1HKX4_9BACT|nr:hypothetical protein [Hymenobacter artigasi]
MPIALQRGSRQRAGQQAKAPAGSIHDDSLGLEG